MLGFQVTLRGTVLSLTATLARTLASKILNKALTQGNVRPSLHAVMWDLQTVLHKRVTHDVFKQQFKVHPTNQGTNSPTLCVLWAPKLCRNTVKLKLASHQVIIWQLTFWECCWRTFCSTVMAGSVGNFVKFKPGVAKCTIYRSPKRYKKEMLRCPLLNQRHYGRHGRVTSASRQ